MSVQSKSSQKASNFLGVPLPQWVRVALQLGLAGGVVAIFIALQGMMQAFSTRDIISGIVSMGQVLLLITFFFVAYVAVSRSGTKHVVLTIVTGGLTGLVSSLLLVILIWLGSIVNLGDVFINATKNMYDLLTLKQGIGPGSQILLLLGTGAGVIGAIVYLLPSLVRRSVLYALITMIAFGLLQDLIRVTLSPWDALAPVVQFLYEANGLSYEGAVGLFVPVAIVSYLWALRREQIQSRINALPSPARKTLRWSSISLGMLLLLLLPVLLGLYLSEVLNEVGRFLLMGLGLNIVVGFAGLLDLGYVAFFAIGAYAVGMLTSPELSTGIVHNWWIALPFAVFAAMAAGVILGIPVLKMRGDYLAIVTMGFGEIVRLLALSDFLKPWEGGAQGIQGILRPDIGPIRFVQTQLDLPLFGRMQFTPQQEYYYLFLAGCLLVIFISIRLKNSRLGRAWMALREDEDVAQAMGINLVATKLMAFGMGASFGGLAGAIFASKLESVYPHSFNLLVSINVLVLIIIGGMGSIPGVIVGALALVGLPELLREVGDYRYLFYGAALVVMMLTRPEGLWPEARRRQELEEFREEGEDEPPELNKPGLVQPGG